MRATILLLASMLVCSLAFAQPITTFPYVENFDAFPLGTAGSGAVSEPNLNNFPGDWGNVNVNDSPPDTDGPQDWYAVQGGTPSGGTGPAGDHTTGAATYLYIEDSGGGANNDTIILLTPVFGIAALTDPRLSVWVHSDANVAGAGFGGDSSFNDLKIEAFFGGSWNLIDSIGVLGTGWTEMTYDLTAFSGFVQFRFRVNNNNFGDFVHDIAIDDFSVFNQPQIDGSIESAGIDYVLPAPYTLAPVSQGAFVQPFATFRNRGLQTLTDVKVKADFGTYQDSVLLDSLTAGQFGSVTYTGFAPTAATTGVLSISATQVDPITSNDMLNVVVGDSVFARDDSTAEGGLGFTGGTGVFGIMFDVTAADNLTSTSFFLNSSTIGDSIRVWLYGYGNQIANEPDTVAIDALDPWIVPSLGWHTLAWPCQPELAVGQYFIAIEQINTNNLGFGYDADGYDASDPLTQNSSFFGDGVSRWTNLEQAVPTLASAFMVRMNFGAVTLPQTAVAATGSNGCVGDVIALTASGTGNYTWTGSDLSGTTGASVTATPTTAGTYTYTATGDLNGCISTASLTVTLDDVPVVTTTADTTICEGTSATLTASGAMAYSWSNGDMTASTTVTPNMTTTYTVDGLNGSCPSATPGSVTVTVNAAPVGTIAGTDVACNGDATGAADLTATGSGALTYAWSNAATTEDLTGLVAGMYDVTITDPAGCSGMASVTISEPAAIATMVVSNNATNGNADGDATASASGGTPPFTYAWDDPGMQTTDMATGLATGTYSVIVTDANGCMDTTSVTVGEYGVSIDKLLDAALIQVYPNPSNGTFTVKDLSAFGAQVHLDILVHDLTGRVVMTAKTQGQDEVNLILPETVKAGIYTLEIRSEDAKAIKRIVVE